MMKFIKILFGMDEQTAVDKKISYAFCESVVASGQSRWHIRRLSGNGLKLGGGADTLALCGHTVCWDLKVEIDEHH